MDSLSITGGRVIDPSAHLDAVTDLHIAEGKILAAGEAPAGFSAAERFDARGQVVCPGLVDLSARLREPGAEHKATIASETRAAACNGITTLCIPPDTRPVIDTPAVAELILHHATAAGMSRVAPLAALTQGLQGTHLAEMAALKEAGCVGVSNALEPITNTEVLRHALEYAASCDLTVFLQPRDPWQGRNGCVHESSVSTRQGLPGIPETAETIAVASYLLLAELTGARVHFCRLSTARAMHMLQEARANDLPVSADVSAHQLALTEIDTAGYDSRNHVYPPLRSQRDRDALRQGVAQGVLDAICSDHQPHEADAKLAPFCVTETGISALDSFLPLSLRQTEELSMSLSDLLACLTCRPAQILGVPAGTLQPGAPADVCVFDPARLWTLTEETMHSAGHNTPFSGWELKGKVTHTVLGGKVVYREN
ncbi:MAG: dihydroorotase [Gammaproteobacteria bacterium]|nr:dihydroorotase [Gammaproteobacteria bacterium]